MDINECDCECHKDDNIHHCFPCCKICEICGKRIEIGFYNSHVKGCRERFPKRSWIFCEHANECPMICPCGPDCICRQKGNMCENRKHKDDKEYDIMSSGNIDAVKEDNKESTDWWKGYYKGVNETRKTLNSHEAFDFGYKMGQKDLQIAMEELKKENEELKSKNKQLETEKTCLFDLIKNSKRYINSALETLNKYMS